MKYTIEIFHQPNEVIVSNDSEWHNFASLTVALDYIKEVAA